MEDAARRPRNDRDLADLMVRRDALRQSAALPGAQLPQVLEAAFAELDGAIEMAAARGLARRRSRPDRTPRPVTRSASCCGRPSPTLRSRFSCLSATGPSGGPTGGPASVNVIEPAQGPALMIVAAASPGHAEARGGDGAADANDADADAEAASAGEVGGGSAGRRTGQGPGSGSPAARGPQPAACCPAAQPGPTGSDRRHRIRRARQVRSILSQAQPAPSSMTSGVGRSAQRSAAPGQCPAGAK
jgi:hypothetical protein